MMKQSFIILLFVFGSAIIISGCSGSEKTAVQRVEHETKTRYMSTTGSDFMRDEIAKGMESVKRLHNSVSYRTFQFDLDNLPTQAELANTDFERRAVQSKVDHHTRAGSALILANQRGKSVILTASHTVAFPDTVWHFAESLGPEPRVEAVSVIQSVSRMLIGSDDLHGFELAVSDAERDLVILYNKWNVSERPELIPLELQTGSSSALEWTDLIYALGYPLGIEMVTRAMVSKPAQSGRRNLVLDASFNRGFNGGSIFAVRGDSKRSAGG